MESTVGPVKQSSAISDKITEQATTTGYNKAIKKKIKGKLKASKSPKSFSKENVVYNRTHYDNSTAFYREYYGDRIDLLVDTIKRYKQLKGKHQRDELYLADLLK